MHKTKVTFSSLRVLVAAAVIVLGVFAFGLSKSSSTGAFINAVVTAFSNQIGLGLLTSCTQGEKWAFEVIDSNQGTLKNNNPITDSARTNPDNTLNINDSSFFSLGKNGSLTVAFEFSVDDGAGTDLVIRETTFGDRMTYPEEKATLEVSQDGTHWVTIPVALTSKATNGENQVDISVTGLSWVKYLRLTDMTDFGPHASTADGFEVESIQALHGECEDLPLEQADISGKKYHDDNRSGEMNDGEAGLANWTIMAATKVWEGTVEAQNTPAIDTAALENGVTYIVRSTGSYDANDSITADAKYSFRSVSSTTWTDAVHTYEGYGPTLLDLQIDGSSPDWGAYNADHVYWTTITGDGTPASLELYDLDNGANNTGSLQVAVYKVLDSAITDAQGNYTLSIIAAAIEDVYLFEEMQDGWDQLEPAAPNYYHTVPADGRESAYNFGNDETQAQAVQLSDVTVCKVNGSQQPLEDWRMVLTQGPALFTSNVYPSNANGALGGNSNAVTTTPALGAGDFVLISNGSYIYRNQVGATTSDAAYSERHPSDPVYGGEFAPWTNVNTFGSPYTGWLGIMVNSSVSDWGSYFNDGHEYAYSLSNFAGGSLSMTILDDQYGDNSGSLAVSAYNGWAQDTAANGCTTFEDVPYGNYDLSEIDKEGWDYQSGDQGSVVVNSPTESFTLTNSEVTADIAPVSSMTVSSSPTKLIENRVVNGGFENGLNNWQAVGDVEIRSSADESLDQTVHGQNVVRIGRATDPGKSVDVNILSQDVSNLGQGVRSLGFWYNFKTYEPGQGFDEPGFMVFIGDKMVHQVWASDVLADNDEATPDQSGWRFLSIDLTDVSDPVLTLAFYAGNTGDLQYQSFVMVDNVTTNEAAVNSSATFTLSATDDVSVSAVHYAYKIGGVTTQGDQAGDTTSFSLPQQPDNGLIEYWAEDGQGNVEEKKSFHVMFDDSAPEIVDDLQVNDDGDGNFTLTWSAPGDANPYGVNQAAEYQVKFAATAAELTDANWETLTAPVVLNSDGQPGGGLRAPLVSGSTETYRVRVEGGASEYWFAVRALDRARNEAPVSLAVSSGNVVSPVEVQEGDVVINEVMWMGSVGSTSDEWVELRNMTDKAIPLTGWSIQGLGNGTDALTLSSGVLPANGYFVIANSSAGSSSLKNDPSYVDAAVELSNSGEQLILVDSTANIVDKTPVVSGSWAVGTNAIDQKQSMERNNMPGDGTDAANWHACNSPSCADVREMYWDAVGGNYGTPGAANLSFDESQIVPTGSVSISEESEAVITLKGIQNFTKAEFVLEYSHKVDGEDVKEAVTGSMDIPAEAREVNSDKLYVGTCSTGQESCVSHLPVTDVKVSITLSSATSQPVQLEILGVQ
jgi:hypothetical protein